MLMVRGRLEELRTWGDGRTDVLADAPDASKLQVIPDDATPCIKQRAKGQILRRSRRSWPVYLSNSRRDDA